MTGIKTSSEEIKILLGSEEDDEAAQKKAEERAKVQEKLDAVNLELMKLHPEDILKLESGLARFKDFETEFRDKMGKMEAAMNVKLEATNAKPEAVTNVKPEAKPDEPTSQKPRRPTSKMPRKMWSREINSKTAQSRNSVLSPSP